MSLEVANSWNKWIFQSFCIIIKIIHFKNKKRKIVKMSTCVFGLQGFVWTLLLIDYEKESWCLLYLNWVPRNRRREKKMKNSVIFSIQIEILSQICIMLLTGQEKVELWKCYLFIFICPFGPIWITPLTDKKKNTKDC